MPVFRFRVAWEDDDNIYRDIELVSGQTFGMFKDTILKAFEFDNKHSSAFYESNDKWHKNRAISSEVKSNIKGAAALSMDKTPVPALVDVPDKKFVFEYDPVKNWTFLISLIGISKDEDFTKKYPCIARSEGIAPPQSGIKGISTEKMMEIEEKYDLGKDEMDEGFGDEGEDSDTQEEGDEYSQDDFAEDNSF